MRRTLRRRNALGWLAAAALAGALHPCAAGAGRLEATVHNAAGDAVPEAVVQALPLGAAEDAPAPPDPVEIDQVDKEYVPYLTAIRVGTRVAFPNHDQIRHHVYSFSEAKTFEIPLYKGMPAERIVFDKPGQVVLGCNIHDWMRAYVFVSETPYFAVTGEDGVAALELPAGDYAVQVWHPELEGEPEATRQRHRVVEGEPLRLDFSIEQKRVWRPRRAPSMDDPSYR